MIACRRGTRVAASMTSLTLSPGGCIVVMGIKERRFDSLPHKVSLEDLVPEDSFYRRLEAALDLSFVRDLGVQEMIPGGLYCENISGETLPVGLTQIL